MENRIHYGEYSLGYWIHLLQSNGIVLPRYQRHFVWSREKVLDLIAALKDGQFVPPITIGAFTTGADVKNYIIDGQQRLTALLLAYVGRYPVLERFEARDINLANDALVDEDEEEDGVDYSRDWTFREIITSGDNSREALKIRCSDDRYVDLEVELSDIDLKNMYLGFSYIVPGSKNPTEEQAFYAREFRALNTSSVALNPLESRRSLYFWKSEYSDFFEPNFAKYVIYMAVPKISHPRCLDFVRCLAFVAEYHKTGRCDTIARGWKKNLEEYYYKYIASVVQSEDSEVFGRFETVFPDRNFRDRMMVLANAVTGLGLLKQYQSIIDIDMNFFGLIYWVLFRGRVLNYGEIEQLKLSLEGKIQSFKRDALHARAPGLFKYLRKRIQTSCEVYQGRMIDE